MQKSEEIENTGFTKLKANGIWCRDDLDSHAFPMGMAQKDGRTNLVFKMHENPAEVFVVFFQAGIKLFDIRLIQEPQDALF
jgi:hypothetical protein